MSKTPILTFDVVNLCSRPKNLLKIPVKGFPTLYVNKTCITRGKGLYRYDFKDTFEGNPRLCALCSQIQEGMALCNWQVTQVDALAADRPI